MARKKKKDKNELKIKQPFNPKSIARARKIVFQGF